MGGQRHVLHARQRMVRLERLGMKNVEPGMADMAAREGVEQGRFIDQRAARGVDQDRAGLDACEPLGVEQAAGLVVQCEMQRDHVGPRQAAHRGSTSATPASGRGERFQAITSMPMPRAMRCDFPADATEPDQAQRLALELHALQRLPHARAHRAVHAGEVAAAGEHQRNGVLGDRGVAIALDGMHRRCRAR